VRSTYVRRSDFEVQRNAEIGLFAQPSKGFPIFLNNNHWKIVRKKRIAFKGSTFFRDERKALISKVLFLINLRSL